VLANSQKNPAWKSIKLGKCNDTIGQSGCYITALGILADKTPPEVNQILKDNGGYTNGCLVNAARAAELLGLEYNGITKEYQNEVCIAETDHYKSSGVPQHFFVWLGRASRIIDTLTGLEMDNPYHIVSFRLFKPKEVTMTDEQKHREAVEWAFRSIYMKEPTKAKIDYIIAQPDGGDIQKVRQAMVDEVCQKKVDDTIAEFKASYAPCPPCPAIDDLSAGELIAKGLRKWLGIK